jgi:hypothetical protein
MVAALRSVVDHHDHSRPARGVERIDLE